MRETREIVTCDICKKEIVSEIPYDIDLGYYEMGRVTELAYDEVCSSCVKRITDVIKIIKSQVE